MMYIIIIIIAVIITIINIIVLIKVRGKRTMFKQNIFIKIQKCEYCKSKADEILLTGVKMKDKILTDEVVFVCSNCRKIKESMK